jgi:hypothetical protein
MSLVNESVLSLSLFFFTTYSAFTVVELLFHKYMSPPFVPLPYFFETDEENMKAYVVKEADFQLQSNDSANDCFPVAACTLPIFALFCTFYFVFKDIVRLRVAALLLVWSLFVLFLVWNTFRSTVPFFEDNSVCSIFDVPEGFIDEGNAYIHSTLSNIRGHPYYRWPENGVWNYDSPRVDYIIGSSHEMPLEH